ncbi:MAG: PstS family phosphate ABC transporter substrate-binding protein [Anaerolineae bacterium]|nr:PstS family phosphate ABC transporter substrate-binding protein [Anaerolineae bacterium]
MSGTVVLPEKTHFKTLGESTKKMKGTLVKIIGLFLALSLMLPIAGAVAQEDVEDIVELPEVDPLSVSGDIITAGSSTVGPLSEAIAERFREDGYAGNITIDIIGSGAGFERFCVSAETDIANASRPIKDSEYQSCLENGREPIEFRVGTDAVAVTVSAANDFAEDVTAEELALIFSTAATWQEVRPEWPTEPICRYIPGTDSGTFDFFVEEIFDSNEEPILAAECLQLSEDDNVLVQGILGSPYAIGFFGYAYYQENADALKILKIDGIEANLATVDAFEYPLARPLFVYSTAQIMAEKPQVADFVNYYLTNVNELIRDVGYFPASDAALNASRAKLYRATMGE